MAEEGMLYETEAVNKDGLNGYTYVENALKLKISNPRSKAPGTNPEQLLGLSLSTCMNATIQAIERERGLRHTSEVRVKVTMVKKTTGLEFLVKARVHIPSVDLETAERFVKLAEKRCPVSKLLSGSANYTIEAVENF
ncbi:OsmC/Ohr family protein [Liquorilactobacillus sucicola DSM 21376 = JCM 15457]|uniref:Redox protein, regulator of disulfide bond formation n=1 Tax=Liquorilactobacillus sucicola DSM 21376 = JCM 15457 TaxID=1423806 RepID=A0A023CXI1_9LACO|nr:OsmC family protein [Liquorilactobacillus sucicola]KRN07093.1 redox protein, regulator of disulfide bond formation [Liquorilactobacillus sucicola DSM 21376 = JCM 15457]GAJ26587.1 OsmC/Ohr family protein [Liquorilactobacillus sucicola DSM 21376 = JCM 15457]